MRFTAGLSSKSDRKTEMPSTIEVRSFGSIRRQSSWNQRRTAANWARLSASGSVGVTSGAPSQHLVEQDDELDEVRVGLLPEGLLATPVEVIEERGDPVGESVGVEVVVQRIVAVLGLEAHLEVVGPAPVPAEDLAHPVAEVALDLQDKAPDAPLRVAVPEGQDLLGEGIHARGGLAAPDRPEDGDAREEASLGNRKPVRT